MSTHKFKVGQNLAFTANRFERQSAGEKFSVIRQLPSDGLEFQYRIRNERSGQERVVRESQLKAAAAPGADRHRD